MTNDDNDEPPAHFDAAARAAWCAGRDKARGQGCWDDLSRLGLEVLAAGSAIYVQTAADPDPTEMHEELRLRIRSMMADWFLLEPDEIELCRTTPAGIDVDIARLCGL